MFEKQDLNIKTRVPSRPSLIKKTYNLWYLFETGLILSDLLGRAYLPLTLSNFNTFKRSLLDDATIPNIKSKNEDKDQGSIYSSTTSYRKHQMGKCQKHKETSHTREPRDQPFSSG